MQKIDAGYLYELGAAIRPLRGLGSTEGEQSWSWMVALSNAREAIHQFVSASIYTEALRTSPHYANVLLQQIDALDRRFKNGDFDENQPRFADYYPMIQAFDKFEPVMIAELQAASIFYVPRRGGFDNDALIEEGVKVFPASIILKVPETEVDLKQAAKCIAFDLPTAAGFHLHRANEAVLRRYFDHVVGKDSRPKVATVGTLLGELKKKDKGDKRIINALDNIKEFHRNPLMHPEHTLSNVDEAISLLWAVSSAMSYMLESLPWDMDTATAKGILTEGILSSVASGQGS